VSGSFCWYGAKGKIWDVNLHDRNGLSGFLRTKNLRSSLLAFMFAGVGRHPHVPIVNSYLI